MLNLYLLRHAKSSRAKLFARDIDRSLNDDGRRAAALMANNMAAKGISPQLVLCSPARRTRQTREVLSERLGEGARVLFEDALYGGGADGYLAPIKQHGEAAGGVLVVGHNPAIEELAGLLVDSGEAAARAAMAESFSAGALAEIGFDLAAWSDIAPGSGSLAAFTRPGDLEPEGAPS